jgi:hypothetical protein
MLCWVCDSARVWKTVLEAIFFPLKFIDTVKSPSLGPLLYTLLLQILFYVAKCVVADCICKHLLGILHHYLIMFSPLFSSSGFFFTLFSSSGFFSINILTIHLPVSLLSFLRPIFKLNYIRIVLIVL